MLYEVITDSASPSRERQIAEVNKVLTEIGASQVPQLLVMNKLDLTDLPPAVERDEYGKITQVRLSAKRGDGVPLLREALAEIALEYLRSSREQFDKAGTDLSLAT